MSEINILTVDDQSEDLEILNHILKKENYNTISAGNGKEAIDLLYSSKNIDIIVLDRMMPVMDGIAFLRRIKEDNRFNHIPVIMQTAADEDEQILEGIEAGVYWYITKPFSAKVLTTIVRSALRMHKRDKKLREITDFYVQRRKKLKSGMAKLTTCEFVFQTLAEAKDVANAVSICFPQPREIVGSCIELLVNAVEHGNLGISFEEKSGLILDGMWEDEIEYRQSMAENRNKKVAVNINKYNDRIEMLIKDDGKGFNHEPYMKLDPARAHKLNGRGIYLASLEFDKLEYRHGGNEVMCSKFF
jgi:CheY-like chemotaxis protein